MNRADHRQVAIAGIFKNADFDVGGVERFTLEGRRFDRCNPLRLVYLLAVRKRAGKIITVNAIKERTIA